MIALLRRRRQSQAASSRQQTKFVTRHRHADLGHLLAPLRQQGVQRPGVENRAGERVCADAVAAFSITHTRSACVQLAQPYGARQPRGTAAYNRHVIFEGIALAHWAGNASGSLVVIGLSEHFTSAGHWHIHAPVCGTIRSANAEKWRMKRILVGIKRVVDYSTRVRVKPDGSGIALDGVKMSINPFDEIALEEALRIKERGAAEEVIAVSIGPADAQQQLRTALAMGADRALLVQAKRASRRWTAARVLLKLVQREQPLLVILGKQAIDDDNSQTGQMLAALWDRPQATFASKIELRVRAPRSPARSTRDSRPSRSSCRLSHD